MSVDEGSTVMRPFAFLPLARGRALAGSDDNVFRVLHHSYLEVQEHRKEPEGASEKHDMQKCAEQLEELLGARSDVGAALAKYREFVTKWCYFDPSDELGQTMPGALGAAAGMGTTAQRPSTADVDDEPSPGGAPKGPKKKGWASLKSQLVEEDDDEEEEE